MEKQPWDSEAAETYIHKLARDENLYVAKTRHAQMQMLKRRIIEYDILYVLKYGAVVSHKTERSTRDGYFKYAIQSETPNSDGDIIRVIVIPCLEPHHITIITVMWKGDREVLNNQGGIESKAESENGADKR